MGALCRAVASARSILLPDDDPDVGIAAQLLGLNFGVGRTDSAQDLRLLEEVRSRTQAPAVVVLTAYAEPAAGEQVRSLAAQERAAVLAQLEYLPVAAWAQVNDPEVNWTRSLPEFGLNIQ